MSGSLPIPQRFEPSHFAADLAVLPRQSGAASHRPRHPLCDAGLRHDARRGTRQHAVL